MLEKFYPPLPPRDDIKYQFYYFVMIFCKYGKNAVKKHYMIDLKNVYESNVWLTSDIGKYDIIGMSYCWTYWSFVSSSPLIPVIPALVYGTYGTGRSANTLRGNYAEALGAFRLS